jgi:hypothetical protein
VISVEAMVANGNADQKGMSMACSIDVRGAAIFSLALLTLAICGSGAARAQATNNPAEINACLCLQQGNEALSREMSVRTQALAEIRQHLADLDAELVHDRPMVQVNDPDSVARYKALLDRRDAAYRQSIGPVVSQADQAVARYNAQVNEYNARCAGHPFNAEMMAEMQTHLSCSAPR